MQAFLSWVYGVSNMVYAWFSSQFWDRIDAIDNFWDWIVSEARKAYRDAVNAVRDWIDDIRQDMTGLYDWVEYQFGRIKDDVLDDVNGLFDWVEYKIQQLQSIEIPSFQDIVDNVYAYIDSIPDRVLNWIYEQVDIVKSWVWDNFGWVQDAYNYLTDLINAIPFDLFPQIWDFLNNRYTDLIMFLDDPKGFILDFIQDEFTEFLSYVLGHALGTVKHELPNNKPWRK